ncbi:uncharacterized protein LOC130956947 [Arachis stenosperma]|uniref:uncharacterized protein LOC130956947 n=1 Tax=Arachis stenosperma TaxID=217475 RepID=UPI0025AC3396|nr:uncharacterized protein LOC130956947 [Arachis stenosperma]
MVGMDNVELSHLQFADDTILFCPQETETLVNYKRLLRCFELMSGLSINFEKSSLISVNCEKEWVTNMCGLLGCGEAVLPVRYLGIPLGANPRLVKTWKPIIDKVEDRLSLWKAKFLNKAGKLVLIKSVLNSLPVYYLSLYKMPKGVADRIIGLQRRFQWSKEDGNNGIPMVKWEVVQAPKKLGGLGVGDALIRNAALLFKWWWRFSKEDCPLWKKIVCSCNQLDPTVMLSNQPVRPRGGPWKDICQLNIKDQQARDMMIRGLLMEVGNGRNIRFWEDAWLQDGSLKECFPRLFSVSNQQGSVIGDCGFWDGIECYIMRRSQQTSQDTTSQAPYGQVWCAWLTFSDRAWVIPGTTKEFYESWIEATGGKSEQRKWLIGFCAVIWNIWLERNSRVFQQVETSVEAAICLIIGLFAMILPLLPLRDDLVTSSSTLFLTRNMALLKTAQCQPMKSFRKVLLYTNDNDTDSLRPMPPLLTKDDATEE